MLQKMLLSATFLSASMILSAQQASKTYAITGKADNKFFWADIKQVDISNGKVNKTFYEAEKTPFKIVNPNNSALKSSATDKRPTGLGVAACALDTRSNRLYFATMHFSDIRYLDLGQPGANFTTVKQDIISLNAATATAGYQPEENHITRMVIAADGFGYALSNDAKHLIRFSTGKNPEVTDLGSLKNGENDKGISIHEKCTGWGGDMVADAFGKLVIISANHNVFSVDVNSRVATLTGTITGLPANFTTNGAAVDDDGELVVSSANVFEGLYKVSMKTLAAQKVKSLEPAFNASDLANGNLLRQREFNEFTKFELIKSSSTLAGDARVFPNPLTGNQFNVVFEGQPAGKYTVVLTDIAGRNLQTKVVSISKNGQVEAIRLNSKTARGTYLVKILSENKQLAFSEKVVIH